MKPIRNQIIRLAVLGCLSCSLTFSALAQSTIEEVFVTATKRQQTLQQVPVAVSVTSADTIEKAQIQDILDLQSVVPSLKVTQLQSSANTNFIIRGFGNGANNAGIEPSVGVFIDGVYRSRSAGAISDLPNLQRVEVLRGPQSTLFGKNASAGVISVTTAKPSQDFSGSAEATVGNYGLNVIKADISNGLTDNLAFSLSGSSNQRDGYFKNLEGTSDDFNERDRSAFRGQLLYTPTDNSEYRLILDSDSIDENCCGVANLVDGPTGAVVRALGGSIVSNSPFAYENYFNKASQTKVDNEGISLQADINFENFDLTSISSYRDQVIRSSQDADFGSADLLSNVGLDQDIQTLTQEIRFTSTGDNKIDWMLGAFYTKEDVYARGEALFGDDIRNYGDTLLQILSAQSGPVTTLTDLENLATAFITPIPFGSGQNFTNQFFVPGTGAVDFTTMDANALSLFGQLDFHLGDKNTLTVGLNHTADEKDVTARFDTDAAFGPLNFGDIIFNQTFFNSFSGTALGAFFPATPTNIAIVESLPPGVVHPQLTGAQLVGAIRAGTAAAGANLIPLQFLPGSVSYPNAVENGKSDDSSTTYTLRFASDVNDYLNVYASYGTGFKASSWNLSRDSRPLLSDATALRSAGLLAPRAEFGTRFAGPEDSSVFELGLKAKFEKGAVNLAVFDQKIEGFQSNVFSGTGFNLANAGQQSTIGLEVDFVYDATDNLTLNLAGTFLDPVFDSFTGAEGIDGPEDLSGKQPSGIPEISTSLSAVYNMEFSNGWNGFLRGNYVYESDVQIVDNVSADIASRQINTLNASFGIATQNEWNFTIWGRNITNDEYLLSAFPSVAQDGSFSGYPNQPRTYGLTVKKLF